MYSTYLCVRTGAAGFRPLVTCPGHLSTRSDYQVLSVLGAVGEEGTRVRGHGHLRYRCRVTRTSSQGHSTSAEHASTANVCEDVQIPDSGVSFCG